MGQMEQHLQGDYEANCEKRVQSGNVRATMQVQSKFKDSRTSRQCAIGNIAIPESDSWLCHMNAPQLTSIVIWFPHP